MAWRSGIIKFLIEEEENSKLLSNIIIGKEQVTWRP